jgi:hypothetical protein
MGQLQTTRCDGWHDCDIQDPEEMDDDDDDNDNNDNNNNNRLSGVQYYVHQSVASR